MIIDNEITPKKVRELLEAITQGEWEYIDGDVKAGDEILCSNRCNTCGSQAGNYKLFATAQVIAQAYLAKCEELDRCKVSIELSREALWGERKENQRLTDIVEKQRDVLRACNFYLTPLSNIIGGRNPQGILNELVCEALSLTTTAEKEEK